MSAASTEYSKRRSTNTRRIWWHEVYDAGKLKALEDEIAKLKKLLAETMLDNAILKGWHFRK